MNDRTLMKQSETCISRRDFWDVLAQSRLLSPAEMIEARAAAASFGQDAVGTATHLADLGLLTHWQSLQLLSGRTSFFLGPYRLIGRLGSGGAGTIYKARHAKLGSIVALKVLSGASRQHPMALARFRREIRAAAAVNHHPNVVATYGGQCVGGVRFLAMEYINGEDLDRWLKRFDVLPLAWCCEVARQAALGLEHIHQHGIVHRDVKPSNLLLIARSPNEPPLAKIADLGAACMNSAAGETPTSLTSVNQFLGTPNFVAPEQVLNARDVDRRADIFSLGCTLFKLLTHKTPWHGATLAEKLLARTKEDAPPPSELRKDIPRQLDQLIARMLARRPDQRYSWAREVAQALQPFAWGAGRAYRVPGAANSMPRRSELVQGDLSKDGCDRDQPLNGAKKWHLERRSDTGPHESYALSRIDRLVIGRAPECDIQVKDLKVSRRHCLLTHQDSQWFLEDLGSNNGTLVNGVAIQRAVLKPGDEFRVGDATLALVHRTPQLDTRQSDTRLSSVEEPTALLPRAAESAAELPTNPLAGLAFPCHDQETQVLCENDTSHPYSGRRRVRFGRRR